MDDGTDFFRENEFSWNKVANMLYIESPAGVGYSFADYEMPEFNDDTSAIDNYNALLSWYELFPEYKEHDLFITGESYAGIYVPYLAHEIIKNKDNAKFDIPLKGIAVGNGVTNWTLDTTNALEAIGFWHNVIDLDLEDRFVEGNCFQAEEGVDINTGKRDKKMCEAAEMEFFSALAGLNIYDLYRHCYREDEGLRMGRATIDGEEKTYTRGMTAFDYTPWVFGGMTRDQLQLKNPPCVYASGVTDYLNRQDVRDALNVKTSQVWELCTDRIAYTRDFNKASEWTYPILKENNIRVLHYTGNTDGSVPAEGTRAWISHMGWDVTTTFRPYYVRNK